MSTLATAKLPTVPFGKYRISRLIMGDNPIYGYSHFNQLLSEHQREANSSDQVMATLRRAEEVGGKRLAKYAYPNDRRQIFGDTAAREARSITSVSAGAETGTDHPSLIDEAATHEPIGMGAPTEARCRRAVSQGESPWASSRYPQAHS